MGGVVCEHEHFSHSQVEARCAEELATAAALLEVRSRKLRDAEGDLQDACRRSYLRDHELEELRLRVREQASVISALERVLGIALSRHPDLFEDLSCLDDETLFALHCWLPSLSMLPVPRSVTKVISPARRCRRPGRDDVSDSNATELISSLREWSPTPRIGASRAPARADVSPHLSPVLAQVRPVRCSSRSATPNRCSNRIPQRGATPISARRQVHSFPGYDTVAGSVRPATPSRMSTQGSCKVPIRFVGQIQGGPHLSGSGAFVHQHR